MKSSHSEKLHDTNMQSYEMILNRLEMAQDEIAMLRKDNSALKRKLYDKYNSECILFESFDKKTVFNISIIDEARGNFEFSLDGDNWYKDVNMPYDLQNNQFFFRGTNPDYFLTREYPDYDDYYIAYDEKNIFASNSSSYFNLSGDISSLLDYTKVDSFEFKNNMDNRISFINLFGGLEYLYSAKNLKLNTLKYTPYIYSYLFSDCKSLVEAPSLDVTVLSEGCYCGMFDNCEALCIPPELPATKLEPFCYALMFRGCFDLKYCPNLPSMHLNQCCYEEMFHACTSLLVTSRLPAMDLADSCYNQMFAECTNLIASPELPATVLADGCYHMMFLLCESLLLAPELPAPNAKASDYQFMFAGCKSLKFPPIIYARNCGDAGVSDDSIILI